MSIWKICFGMCMLPLFTTCTKTVDHAWRNDITIINSFNQEVNIKLYWSLTTFKIPAGKSYVYRQESSDGPHLDFDDSDSIIVTFFDGKEKIDYNCSDKAVESVVKDCSKDTVSLFNSFRYTTIKQSERNYMNYYSITQADYDEAK
ncbi:MAG: hypothetical protein K1X81_07840 [Bacteroidia bacterium]|nr:hypothetical protein [Bacteroidia bacterium]